MRTLDTGETDPLQRASVFCRAALGWGLVFPFISGSLLAQGSETRARIVQHHFAYRPDGDGPFPTIVAIPGCSGIAFDDPALEATHADLGEDDRLFRRHYRRAADRLREAGYAVLLIHVHEAEGLVTACAGELRDDVLADYVRASVGWVPELSYVDARRVHVIGWSMGGRAVLSWLATGPVELGSVQSATVVYPSCPSAGAVAHGIPLLMLLGGADDIADPDECEELVARSPRGSDVTVHRYPGARHGYDIEGAPAVLDIGNGMTVGFQQEAANATWREILAFLSRTAEP